jgi:hypothetical protein
MGSFVSYLYYKNSVEGTGSTATSDVVPSSEVAASTAGVESIPIRHRPTIYEPELQIEQPPAQ